MTSSGLHLAGYASGNPSAFQPQAGEKRSLFRSISATRSSYDAIAVAEHGQTLKWVLEVCQRQQERIALLEEAVAQLKDEIAILKGEKPRPRINPSTLTKDTAPGESAPRRVRGGKEPKELEIHETLIVQPEQIPTGSIFEGL